jgi:dihydroorotate dehydrogenase
MDLYQSLFRPVFFRMQPETAHHLTIEMLKLAQAFPGVIPIMARFFAPSLPQTPVEAFGLKFSNPIGLAAGYDKDGEVIEGLAALGFGHVEIGTVTPRPQPGNPGVRVFRIPEEEAVINRMGFPNRGSEFMLNKLRQARRRGTVVGVNLGKNKTTPLEEAPADYLRLLEDFAQQADYLVINISSPNTPGLRQLQSFAALDALLQQIAARRAELEVQLSRRLPVLVKLAPDLSNTEIDDALAAIQNSRMDGVVASNTSISRQGLRSEKGREEGGLSGRPLTARSTEMVQYIHRHTNGRLPIVGVGGVMNVHDMQEKLDAGACLVQVYTGMIYAGPGLVQQILNELAKEYGQQTLGNPQPEYFSR